MLAGPHQADAKLAKKLAKKLAELEPYEIAVARLEALIERAIDATELRLAMRQFRGGRTSWQSCSRAVNRLSNSSSKPRCFPPCD